MKKFILEYINTIAYAVTGLVFGFAFFLLFFNFYHAKEVSEKYIKSDSYIDAYTKNKDKIEAIKNNISGFDANSFRGNSAQMDLVALKGRLDACVNSIENSDRTKKLLAKKEIGIEDVYNLLIYYQSDIVNECVTMQLYSLKGYQSNLQSFEAIKPFIENTGAILSNDLDYVKRNLQNNSSFAFSSDYDKINVFNMTRDSYTRIELSYQNSIDFVLNVSEWFRKVVGGEI